MTCIRLRLSPTAMVALSGLAVSALALGGCAGTGTPGMVDTPAAPPPVVQAMPASIRADEIVGRWGYASYHKDTDRARTETAARGQCGHPYVIGKGPTGGVMMLMHDSPKQQELVLKGGPGGKNYVGPPGEAGQPNDREVVSFDGRVMQLRWIDPEVLGRYGTGVFVRCGPRA
jgi:hypothetical protein